MNPDYMTRTPKQAIYADIWQAIQRSDLLIVCGGRSQGKTTWIVTLRAAQ